MTFRYTILSILLAAGVAPAIGAVTIDELSIRTDSERQIESWNRFADDLYRLHQQRTKQQAIRTSKAKGRYGGQLWGEVAYEDTSFYDRKTGRLLSRIRRDLADPKNIHILELFIYNPSGAVERDYVAAYLPGFRNSPVQTLINLHGYDKGLHAYRQFDASDRLIYEQCEGEYFGEPVAFSFEDWEMPDRASELDDMMAREAYRACFDGLPMSARGFLNPGAELAVDHPSAVPTGDALDSEQIEARINKLTRDLEKNPNDAGLHVKRADAYFLLRQFEQAIAYYTAAIALDDTLDQAYFGRGMARGRAGEIEEGIQDLTVFIERNPNNSRAYTKRGVRNIWAGNIEAARHDLEWAVVLDETNAEAHDDLGVVYARQKRYDVAVKHFQAAIHHDPSYQKAFHNLAIVYFVTGRNNDALTAVDRALVLIPDSRNSLLLKGSILESLGRRDEAEAIVEAAEFLPKGNWSEQFAIQ